MRKTPIIPFRKCCEIIAALKYVNKVIPQENKDKIAAFHKYKFDAMFVGDDWKGSELFSKCEAELKKYGADVVYFPYTKKVSSTKLRDELKEGERPIGYDSSDDNPDTRKFFRMQEILDNSN